MSVRADTMTVDEVKAAAYPILAAALAPFGFRSVEVEEEEDFDGQVVFRMTADVRSRVPAQQLIDVLGAIHEALRSAGEDRFVYLSTRRPGREAVVQDTD